MATTTAALRSTAAQPENRPLVGWNRSTTASPSSCRRAMVSSPFWADIGPLRIAGGVRANSMLGR